MGATVYGSRSANHLLGLHGLAERGIEVEPHRRYEIGPFTVTFVPSVHSKLIAGWKIPSDGELTCDCLEDLGASAYRCGQVWGLRIEVGGGVLYHQGSADLLDDEVPAGPVDVFLCGIAGRGFTPRFVERAIAAIDPSVIVAHHHDDFFRPVTGPMGFSFNVNLGGFVADVARVAPSLPVHTMRPLTPLRA
jgi:L-ascorbate metabolism protein UlaG (beta-lactamase superfamily)